MWCPVVTAPYNSANNSETVRDSDSRNGQLYQKIAYIYTVELCHYVTYDLNDLGHLSYGCNIHSLDINGLTGLF